MEVKHKTGTNFLCQAKSRYEFTNGLQNAIGVMYGQPHGDNPSGDGKKNDADAGNIDAMTATSLIRGNNSFKIYDEQWQTATKSCEGKRVYPIFSVGRGKTFR